MNSARAETPGAGVLWRHRGGGLLGAGLIALVLIATASARADVVTLAPDRDNTLFEDPTGSLSNGAGPVVFSGNNGQDLTRRTLLRFDIAGNLPLGARIDSVKLQLTCSNASNATPRTFTLHRVTADWGEGTSSATGGSGAPATAGDATWVHTFFFNSLWGSLGGDFASPSSAAQTVGDVGVYTWTSAGMKADVQEWLNGTTPNYGWLLLGDEGILNTARRFDSRENTISVNRPALTVHYAFNTTGVGAEAADRSVAVLEAPAPNPTRGGCRIGFVLPIDADVRVVVDDVAGRRVATLAEGRYGPGRWEVRWDGLGPSRETPAAGIYFCRLVVDGRLVASRTLARLH